MGAFSSAIEFKRAVTGQGGLLTGVDPASFSTSDPLRLWAIQLGIILMMAQILGYLLGRIRQPRVIAEIIGGILLGPTALGRIPGFTQHIFPAASLPYLSLTANIGLCLFLFLIGLEIDPTIIRRNARMAVAVSFAGIIFPFGIGCGISVAIYRHFISSDIPFHYFMLFIGVSFSITAFPVLCRVLSALKLLDTTVGLIVLSAGVANDVIGWSLLALAVAFVNATSGLSALWVFLTCMAYTLFLLFPVRWVLLWLARKTGSTVHGPTMIYMTIVILVLWASAFFTDIIGVNAIFGSFVVGVIVPREGGISMAFVEKLEDMVQIIFLPLYFTVSGLNTNLGLINTGTAWGFVFAIATLDFTGKFTGCSLSARAMGFSWREATTVGSLMTCKGLVELIVLNIGLSAQILTQEVFSMFVFEAVLLTFMTTPLVNLIYPDKHRTYEKVVLATSDSGKERSVGESSEGAEPGGLRHRFAVALDQFEHMPAIMALTKLVVPPFDTYRKTSVNALRLMELSERTSTVMKSAITDTLINTDPLVGVFKMFSEQSDMSVAVSLSVRPEDEWGDAVAVHAERHDSELVLIPWIPPAVGSVKGEKHDANTTPFDIFFGRSKSSTGDDAATLSSYFVRRVFQNCKTDVALYVDVGDRGGHAEQHVFFPFFGGADDRLGLELVAQLCTNAKVSATVVRVGKREVVARPESAMVDDKTEVDVQAGFPSTVYGMADTTYLLQSETADNLVWARYATPMENKDDNMRAILSRIRFDEVDDTLPVHAVVERARRLCETHRRVVVVVGRSKRITKEHVRKEVKEMVGEQEVVRSTVGEVGMAFVLTSGARHGVVVVQAAEESGESREV